MSGVTIIYQNGRTTTYRPTAEAEERIDALHEKIGPGRSTHDELWQITTCMPTDFEPWGKRERDGSDCSCGCNFYHVLDGPQGADWGVCTNPKSPRVGLLTFEHMGCPEWTEDPRWEQIDKERMKILRADKRKQKKVS